VSGTISREAAHTSGLYQKRDIAIVRGEGARVWDDAGREYIDCVGGQGSGNLGHANAAVADALARQARTLSFCTELFYNDRRAELYDRLARILPPSLDRIFLCNSGTEAVEGALKFARLATKRTQVVATMRGFHGKTMGALSATWGPEYRELFGPLLEGFSHIPFNKTEALDAAITPRTSAFIVELVQGEGGVRPATQEFIAEAARICRERGVLLIVDEVQTGFGRTGTMFAIEQYGIVPDVLCLAKSTPEVFRWARSRSRGRSVNSPSGRTRRPSAGTRSPARRRSRRSTNIFASGSLRRRRSEGPNCTMAWSRSSRQRCARSAASGSSWASSSRRTPARRSRRSRSTVSSPSVPAPRWSGTCRRS